MKGNLCRCTGYRPIREAITAGPLAREPDGDGRRGRSVGRRAGRAADRDRPRAVHARRRRARAAAPQGARQPARPRAGRAGRRHRRPRGARAWSRSSPPTTRPTSPSRPPGTRTGSTTPTTPACSTAWCGSAGSAWPSSLAESVGAAEAGLPGARGHVRAAARRTTTRSARATTARPCCTATRTRSWRGSPTPPGTWSPSCTASTATSRPACARPTPWCAGAGGRSGSRTSRSRPTPRIGWLDDDGRLVLRTSSQVPVPGARRDRARLRAGARPGPGVHRPRRRRLRRQAGDPHRGPRRAGRAGDRPAGVVRDDPDRRVHGRALPAPVPGRRHARGHPRRDG